MTADVMPEVCVFVFALMLAANEVEAVRMALFVFALTTPAIEDEAFKILVFAVVIFVFAVFMFVLAVASEAPRLDDAARTLPFVVVTFVPMVARVAPRDVEARSV